MCSPALVKDRFDRTFHRLSSTNGHRDPTFLRQAWRAISRTFKGFADGLAEGRRRARAYEELAEMSDAELHDLGIYRGDIPAVICGTYRRTLPQIPDPTSGSRRERSPSLERRGQSRSMKDIAALRDITAASGPDISAARGSNDRVAGEGVEPRSLHPAESD